jgi:NAD(P)-dependent dehydrogenase (short-subunit alcohol dehydrogenase family)
MVVTGGGRGIGAATSRLAAQRGYAVCVNYLRNRDAAEGVVRDIQSSGGSAKAVAGDIASESDVVRLFGEAANWARSTLVNNAGILERQARLTKWKRRASSAFAINITGAFLVRGRQCGESTRHAARRAIVNVLLDGLAPGLPGEYVDYAASRGAIDSLTIGLAEVAAEGIRVNAVRPGVIYTEIHASGGEPGRVDRVKSAVPMQRGGQPDEVARAILWLCSDESSYSTGTFIDVSGGR